MVASSRTACQESFMKCRQSEREVGPIIQKCNKATTATTTTTTTTTTSTTNASVATIKSIVAQLTKSKEQVSGVKNKIIKLTTSSNRNKRGPPTDCNGVIVLVKIYTEKLQIYSHHIDMTSEYTDIIGVKLEAGSCANTKLTNYVTTLTIITTTIDNDIKTHQDHLEGKWNYLVCTFHVNML